VKLEEAMASVDEALSELGKAPDEIEEVRARHRGAGYDLDDIDHALADIVGSAGGDRLVAAALSRVARDRRRPSPSSMQAPEPRSATGSDPDELRAPERPSAADLFAALMEAESEPPPPLDAGAFAGEPEPEPEPEPAETAGEPEPEPEPAPAPAPEPVPEPAPEPAMSAAQLDSVLDALLSDDGLGDEDDNPPDDMFDHVVPEPSEDPTADATGSTGDAELDAFLARDATVNVVAPEQLDPIAAMDAELDELSSKPPSFSPPASRPRRDNTNVFLTEGHVGEMGRIAAPPGEELELLDDDIEILDADDLLEEEEGEAEPKKGLLKKIFGGD
jgi:outer membrane biosynthesis protein TonB